MALCDQVMGHDQNAFVRPECPRKPKKKPRRIFPPFVPAKVIPPIVFSFIYLPPFLDDILEWFGLGLEGFREFQKITCRILDTPYLMSHVIQKQSAKLVIDGFVKFQQGFPLVACFPKVNKTKDIAPK